MFLVELSHNTIKEEIEDLDYKGKRKEIALKDSNVKLENDNIKLMKFIDQDNQTTTLKEKEAEEITKDRKNKEVKIKNIDQKIQSLKSEIDKNKDILTALEAHKEFLVKISPEQWVSEQERDK